MKLSKRLPAWAKSLARQCTPWCYRLQALRRRMRATRTTIEPIRVGLSVSATLIRSWRIFDSTIQRLLCPDSLKERLGILPPSQHRVLGERDGWPNTDGLSQDGVTAGPSLIFGQGSCLSSPAHPLQSPHRNCPQIRSAASDRRRALAKASRPNPPMCPLRYPFLRHLPGTPSKAVNDAACMSVRKREAPIPGTQIQARKRPEETTATIN